MWTNCIVTLNYNFVIFIFVINLVKVNLISSESHYVTELFCPAQLTGILFSAPIEITIN